MVVLQSYTSAKKLLLQDKKGKERREEKNEKLKEAHHLIYKLISNSDATNSNEQKIAQIKDFILNVQESMNNLIKFQREFENPASLLGASPDDFKELFMAIQTICLHNNLSGKEFILKSKYFLCCSDNNVPAYTETAGKLLKFLDSYLDACSDPEKLCSFLKSYNISPQYDPPSVTSSTQENEVYENSLNFPTTPANVSQTSDSAQNSISSPGFVARDRFPNANRETSSTQENEVYENSLNFPTTPTNASQTSDSAQNSINSPGFEVRDEFYRSNPNTPVTPMAVAFPSSSPSRISHTTPTNMTPAKRSLSSVFHSIPTNLKSSPSFSVLDLNSSSPTNFSHHLTPPASPSLKPEADVTVALLNDNLDDELECKRRRLLSLPKTYPMPPVPISSEQRNLHNQLNQHESSVTFLQFTNTSKTTNCGSPTKPFIVSPISNFSTFSPVDPFTITMSPSSPFFEDKEKENSFSKSKKISYLNTSSTRVKTDLSEEYLQLSRSRINFHFDPPDENSGFDLIQNSFTNSPSSGSQLQISIDPLESMIRELSSKNRRQSEPEQEQPQIAKDQKSIQRDIDDQRKIYIKICEAILDDKIDKKMHEKLQKLVKKILTKKVTAEDFKEIVDILNSCKDRKAQKILISNLRELARRQNLLSPQKTGELYFTFFKNIKNENEYIALALHLYNFEKETILIKAEENAVRGNVRNLFKKNIRKQYTCYSNKDEKGREKIDLFFKSRKRVDGSDHFSISTSVQTL